MTKLSESGIPCLTGLPLLGNLPDFVSNRLDFLSRVNRECGDIGAFYLRSCPYIMVNTSELAYQVLMEQANKFERGPGARIFARHLLGHGLFTSENESHKKLRKLVAPAFQHRRISSYADSMVSYSDQLQRGWSEGQIIDISQEMMRLTLWVAGKVFFDADVLMEAKELGEALTTAIRLFTTEVNSFIRLPPIWSTPRRKRIRKAFDRLSATIYQIIEERHHLGEDRGDFLSILLQSRDEDGNFMSDMQVRDEALEFLMAGHETTANALAWTWYLLSQHSDVYCKMCKEIDLVLDHRMPKVSDLINLPYTLQVFKEAMRLYPPAFVLARQAIHPVVIGGYSIPTGTVVLISPYVMHRRPDYFFDPDRFNPDRFAPQIEKCLPRYTYIPFGGGPRICIGDRFALMEGHLVLATLAQQVTFKLGGGQHIHAEPLITLRPEPGIKMIVSRHTTK